MPETKGYLLGTFLVGAVSFLFIFGPLAGRGAVGGISISGRSDFPPIPDRQILTPFARTGEPPPELGAKAVFLKDRQSAKVLYEKNATSSLPIASLTKLMTALVVKSRVSPEEMVEIRQEDIEVSPFKTGLQPGEKVLVKDLLRAMLVASANDAAKALARHAGGGVENFVSYMNQQAEILKMRDTAFQNPVGFDEAGQFSTARDLAVLVEEFLADSDLMEIVGQKEIAFYPLNTGRAQHLVSTNRLLQNPAVLGIKTGYTSEAKGNIIILAQAPPRSVSSPSYYFIILGSDNREADAQKLITWVEENYTWLP